MKELTIDQKAKRYDEALERAKIWKDKSGMPKDKQGILDNIFPELAESKDEKVRKWIIDDIRYNMYNETLENSEYKRQGERAIVCLEKQHTDPYNGVCFNCYGHHWGMCARDNGIEIVMDGKPVRHFSYKDCEQTFGGRTALEAAKEVKVDNQNCVKPVDFKAEHFYVSKVDGQIHDMTYNPADKVEPKFRNGQWIVSNITKNIFLIKSFNSGYCTLEDAKGRIYTPCLPPTEDDYHLYTIQDAKDGDVLIDKSNGRESPFIFKTTKLSDIKTDILNPLTVLGYCGIGGAGFTKGSGWGDTVNCIYYPATKEQRDLLFQKMKEEGYVWDAEKKEVKEINLIDKGKANGLMSLDEAIEHCKEKSCGNSACALEHKQLGEWLTELKELKEHKSTWSEEDEKFVTNLVDYFKVNGELQYSELRIVHWLKSLKQKIGG